MSILDRREMFAAGAGILSAMLPGIADPTRPTLAELATTYERCRDLWVNSGIDEADDAECNRRTIAYHDAAATFLEECRRQAGPDACGALVGGRLVIAGNATHDPDGDPWALASICVGRIAGLTSTPHARS